MSQATRQWDLYAILSLFWADAGRRSRALTSTLTPTPDHGRRVGVGAFVAKKNANGEGSRPCKRPDGRWEARYWFEGRRRSVYGETRKEVAEKLAKAVAVEEDPPAYVATNITWASFWCSTRMR